MLTQMPRKRATKLIRVTPSQFKELKMNRLIPQEPLNKVLDRFMRKNKRLRL